MSKFFNDLPNKEKLACPANEEAFLNRVKNTVGFNELHATDRLAYVTGARMMFQKMAAWAEVEILGLHDAVDSADRRTNAAEEDLRTLSSIIQNTRETNDEL